MMKKLSLFALAAASTVLAPAAMAQTAAPGGPGPGANHAVGVASQAGHTWREGARPQVRHIAPQVHQTLPPQMRHSVPPPPPPRIGQGVGKSVHHMGGRFGHIRRIDRGGMLPHGWNGRRHHIRNWNLYGFYQPFFGGHWVRYYDDALLVDPYGRVVDTRYGVDWNVEGDRWGYDDDGAPFYVGDGDDDEDDRYDDEWAEEVARGPDQGPIGEGRRYTHAYPGHVPPGYDCDCGPQGPYGYGAYGYAYGWGPVLVTETVVTTNPVVESVTRYEYVTERAPRVKHRPAYRSKTKLRRIK